MNKLILLLLPLLIGGKVDYNPQIFGTSMLPTITCKDTIIVNTVTKYDNITIGDIYCYRPDYRDFYIPAYSYVCHRLINISEGLYYFHGDNNKNFYDAPVVRKYIAWEIVNIMKVEK